MTRTYTQPDITGGAVVVPIRPLASGDLDRPAPKLRGRASFGRLMKLQTAAIANRDAVGGWDAYFDAGGAAAFRTSKKTRTTSKTRTEPDVEPVAIDLQAATRRLAKAERALLQAQADYRAAATADDPRRVARRAGPQWFAQMYRSLRKEA